MVRFPKKDSSIQMCLFWGFNAHLQVSKGSTGTCTSPHKPCLPSIAAPAGQHQAHLSRFAAAQRVPWWMTPNILQVREPGKHLFYRILQPNFIHCVP